MSSCGSFICEKCFILKEMKAYKHPLMLAYIDEDNPAKGFKFIIDPETGKVDWGKIEWTNEMKTLLSEYSPKVICSGCNKENNQFDPYFFERDKNGMQKVEEEEERMKEEKRMKEEVDKKRKLDIDKRIKVNNLNDQIKKLEEDLKNCCNWLCAPKNIKEQLTTKLNALILKRKKLIDPFYIKRKKIRCAIADDLDAFIKLLAQEHKIIKTITDEKVRLELKRLFEKHLKVTETVVKYFKMECEK